MTDEVLTPENAKTALRIVRENIESYLNDKHYQLDEKLDDVFYEKRGVFVTLNKQGNLRGCIGFIEPYETLIDGLLDVSLSAAFDDPRFSPLSIEEFKELEIEISILTKPEEIIVDNFEEYPSKINIGEDGLIIEHQYRKGVFLPQVPIEQKWDINQYLENLCYKAGLPSQTWKLKETKIYKFQAQIINE